MGDSKWATLSMDLMMLVNMSNEIVLLFIVILQVMTVNDAADKLGTALSQARWGTHDSEAEWRRHADVGRNSGEPLLLRNGR